MKQRDIVIVNAVSDILDLKKNNPSKIDDELIALLMEKNRTRFKGESKLLLISCANKALKFKSKNPLVGPKELTQKLLNEEIETDNQAS
jgi:hypothetical protein